MAVDLSNLQPVALGLRPSFGFGDRLGLATAGHVEAMRRAGGGIAPIFAQQSIREMTRTGRTPEAVMADACNALANADWRGVFAADADHLKTTADVDATCAAGFTFYTIDPSGYVDGKAGAYPEPALRDRFADVRPSIDWFEHYLGKRVELPTGAKIELDEQALMRAAVKCGHALAKAIELASYIRQVNEAAGRDYEIELSIDETDDLTTLAEHYVIADQCVKRGMKLVSLAPRFIGGLEKGIDYIGDARAFERSVRDHAAIAELLGPYKLSLHSGSDKLSIYPALSRATRGRFHVKTAGTSYLEALRVAAIHDPPLLRRICEFARAHYDVDKATYHIHATLESVPPPGALNDRELEQIYLERWDDVEPGRGFNAPGRQILHCTFGSVLTDPSLGIALRDCLITHQDTYNEVLAAHFERHLRALQAGC
ncbi:MAG TPA: tagaturonate epimerase family protein [Lacipirellulaceae bacterium]|nr:tagaturonate epimerase family protein [Lacipirellulaceae bacterium]